MTDLSGNIIEEYTYTEEGILSSVIIKNATGEEWIELLPNPEEDSDGEFYWTIKSQGKTIGTVSGFINSENYSLYIKDIGLDIGPDALMNRDQGVATSVLSFIFEHYKRKDIYAGLSSVYGYTSNPISFEIFFKLSNNNQKEIGNTEEAAFFNHDDLNSLFHHIATSNSYTIILTNNQEEYFNPLGNRTKSPSFISTLSPSSVATITLPS